MPIGLTGYLPDPPKRDDETPDWRAERLLGAAEPPEWANEISPHVVSILDQGRQDCVAHGITQAIRAAHSLAGVPSPELPSREWVYLLARLQHDARFEDRGTYIRLCFDALRREGYPPESAWPYGGEVRGRPRWQQLPDDEARRLAHDQIAPLAYYRIAATGDDRVRQVKVALAQGRPVVFGTGIAESFYRVASMAPVMPPSRSETIVGGHAWVLTAYDQQGAIGPNSWGEHWGGSLLELDPELHGRPTARGWVRLSWDYLADPITRDLWAVVAPPPFPRGDA